MTRADVVALIDLAATIPIRTDVERFTLHDMDVALWRLSTGEISGAVVIDIASTG